MKEEYYDDNYISNVEEKHEPVITLKGINQYLQDHKHEGIKIPTIPPSAKEFTRVLTAHKADPIFIQNLHADEALNDKALNLVESALLGAEIPLTQSFFLAQSLFE